MKVAVVTGMARTAGIGHAICNSLLKAGYFVIGLDHVPLDQTSSLLEQHGFCAKVASVTDLSAVLCSIAQGMEELKKQQRQQQGESNTHNSISVVVNNAGIAQPFLQNPPVTSQSTTNQDERQEILKRRVVEFDTCLNVNLRSAFLVTEICRSYFPKQSAVDSGSSRSTASVIHIASTRAHQSPANCPDECPFGQEGYAAAKAGLLGLMHSQGHSLSGIARVNVISPGYIDTADPDDYVPTREDHDSHAGSQRVGLPRDVAECVCFLADESKSGFITCQEFILDGGVSRKMVYPP